MSHLGIHRRARRLLFPLTIALLFAGTAGAQVVVGGASVDGHLKVRTTTDADALLFEVDPTGAVVRVGTHGANAVDTDFEVIDHNNGAPALSVDSSSAILSIGDATSSDDGDLFVYDDSGNVTLTVNGNTGALILGTAGQDGDFLVRNGAGSDTFVVDGETGTATQPLGAEGLLKAWCRVDAAGNFIDGYRCTDGMVDGTTYPYRSALGTYFVDFTALGTDITSRPVVVTCTGLDTTQCRGAAARFQTDTSVIKVFTGEAEDDPFTILVF